MTKLCGVTVYIAIYDQAVYVVWYDSVYCYL